MPELKCKLAFMVGNKLRKILKERGYSQVAFAEMVGVEYKTLNNYITGRREPDLATLKRIANVLKVPVGYFFDEIDINNIKGLDIKLEKIPEVKLHFGNREDIPEDIRVQDYEFIPLMESKAAATPGVLEIATDIIEGWACIHTSRLPKNNGDLFAFKVTGDSMLPELRANDIVAVQRYSIPPDPVRITLNNIYLVRLPDGVNDYGLSLKRVQVADDRHIILVSDNPKFRPHLIDLERDVGFAIVGKVVWMWREFCYSTK